MIMNVINLICIIFDLIQIARMRCNSTNTINKQAPICSKIGMPQPLVMFIIINIIGSEAIEKK